MLIQGAAHDPVARALGDRDGLPGQHGLVHVALAVAHLAVDGDALARAHQQQVARCNLRSGDGLLAPLSQYAGGFRLEADELLDGGRGATLGHRLQILAQQDDGDDHRGRVEIEVTCLLRKQDRPDQHHHAVEPGRSGAAHDQSVHVRREVTQGDPTGAEETTSRPEQQDGGECCLGPVPDRSGGQCQQAPLQSRHEGRPHGQHQYGQGQSQGEDEVAAHRAPLRFARLLLALFDFLSVQNARLVAGIAHGP